MNKMIKDILILTGITVIAGLLLGFFYNFTKGPISAQQEKIKQEAYLRVFPEAVSIETDALLEEELASEHSYLTEAGYEQERIDEVMLAKDASGNVLGYVLTITTKEGYAGDITISAGITEEGTITGLEILSINETAGLGMMADTDEFKNQFADRTVAKFSYTKTGAAADYEIDALSGATITTNAMVNAVDAGLAFFEAARLDDVYGGGTNE
ncbi:MAG: RnfABCDGE type electron transport complex subunit G [Lachnospiraceae bacterium]